ncbi:MAG: zf-TFIIB domain-containing protein [Polyangiaceae bacterium]
MSLTCPSCKVSMTEQSVATQHGQHATVDICPECKGLWLDAQELVLVCPTVADLPARKTEILLLGHAGRNIPVCPRCTAVPYEFELMEDMLVDFCPQCHGVWLDGDEYEESVLEPAAPAKGREKSPYRSSAQKAEKKSEVDCGGCARPTIVAKSYVWEHGFLCHVCFLAQDLQVKKQAAREATGPMEWLLERLWLAFGPGDRGRPY